MPLLWSHKRPAPALLTKLQSAYKARTDAERSFDAVDSRVSEDLRAEWEKLPLGTWEEDGVLRSVYRAHQDKSAFPPSPHDEPAAYVAQQCRNTTCWLPR